MNTHILPLLCVMFAVCFLCFVSIVYNLLPVFASHLSQGTGTTKRP